MIRVKRVYDPPAPEDGARILVDRLWPRGLTKAAARLDDWAKPLAPSDDLRRWYHAHPEGWNRFCERYREELATPEAAQALAALRARAKAGTVTLLFASKNLVRNNADALAEIVAQRR
ncbi:MAG: DUF488 family protein [Methylobacteriaceae bacterium]|nr:DUF488 family protein [Methylobacteriaceae bacterium]